MAECAAEQGFSDSVKGRFDFWENPIKVPTRSKYSYQMKIVSIEQEIATLLTEELDGSLTRKYPSGLGKFDARLKVHPPLSVSHQTIKTYSTEQLRGVLDIAGFAESHGLTQADEEVFKI